MIYMKSYKNSMYYTTYMVFTPISLRYLKSVQKINHLQKIVCNESFLFFCTENEMEIILFFCTEYKLGSGMNLFINNRWRFMIS